jgi:hypothetical protein
MDHSTLVTFPNAWTGSADSDLAEIKAGIALVSRGLATRVRLIGLAHPEAVAAAGLALAQASRVGFSLERGSGGIAAITLGPRTDR